MSNIVNLKYDERFGNVFISLYPKPQDYKNSVKESINQDIKPPRVNETFEIGDSRFLDEFPELIGLINSFQTQQPKNITARIDRGNNKLGIVGETQGGDPISVVETLTYANNSGTYQAIDNSELGNVIFSVSKQNVERLSPFFSTTLTIDGVDGNGKITNVSFGKLKPLFVFDRNVIEAPLVNEGTFGDIPFERVAMQPDFDQGLVNDTINPVYGGLFPEVEFTDGDYYISDNNVLIKTTIEKSIETESIEGLNLNIIKVEIRFNASLDQAMRVPFLILITEVNNNFDYTGVISTELGTFNINNLYLNNESILDGAIGKISYDAELSKTIIEITYSSMSIIDTPREGDTLFINFNTVEGYGGTPALDTLNLERTNYDIVNYEIINGGEEFGIGQSFIYEIYNGFVENIIKTELTDGNWSISQNDIEEELFYRIDLSSKFASPTFQEDFYSFSGLFERVGNRFKYVQTPSNNLSFIEEPVFQLPIAEVERIGNVIRPDRFLLQNIVLSNLSRNLDVRPTPDYDDKLMIDNEFRHIGIIGQMDPESTSETLNQFIANPAGCIECTQGIEQTYLINRSTHQIAVVSESGDYATYSYDIVEEVQ